MPKHRQLWNASTYQRYLKEGRGQGEGVKYNPWVHIQDFSSNGTVSRIKGTKTGRVHHFMSNLETMFFFLLDWSDDVSDIREQYPLLDLVNAIEIAEKAKIRYPYDPKSGFPYVMTSDFFIETNKEPMVITIKPSSDLKKERVIEKLEIERRYWNNRNVSWKIVTENEINKTKAKNIEWLSQARDLSCFGISENDSAIYCEYFIIRYENSPDNSLAGIVNDFEENFKLPVGIGLNIFKNLAFWKRIKFDVNMNFSDYTRINAYKQREVCNG